MNNILKKINKIKKMEDVVNKSRKEYYLNKKSKDKLDSDFKKLYNEYVKLEKVIEYELNNK